MPKNKNPKNEPMYRNWLICIQLKLVKRVRLGVRSDPDLPSSIVSKSDQIGSFLSQSDSFEEPMLEIATKSLQRKQKMTIRTQHEIAFPLAKLFCNISQKCHLYLILKTRIAPAIIKVTILASIIGRESINMPYISHKEMPVHITTNIRSEISLVDFVLMALIN